MCNPDGQVAYTHVPLFTKQYNLVLVGQRAMIRAHSFLW